MQKPFMVLCLCLVLTSAAAFAQPPPRADVLARIQSGDFPQSYRGMAEAYDATDVPALLAMLASDAEEEHWPRVVTILGIVGDERAVLVLTELIERPRDRPLALGQSDVRRAALLALGYLINRTGSEQALTYLIDGLTPGTWRQRNVQGGTAEFAESPERYDSRLSGYALEGLALSGHLRAGEALRVLRRMPALRDVHRDSTISQWLEVHQLVAERGVAGMYEHYDEQRRIDAARAEEEAERRREEQRAAQRRFEAERIVPTPPPPR